MNDKKNSPKRTYTERHQGCFSEAEKPIAFSSHGDLVINNRVELVNLPQESGLARPVDQTMTHRSSESISGGLIPGGTPTILSPTTKRKSKMSLCQVEYAEFQWNPVSGCTKISDACLHCYAESAANRYKRSFTVTLKPNKLEEPLFYEEPAVIFTDSMGDFFHEDIPFDYLKQIFEVMEEASQHVMLVFTKRSDRLKLLSYELPWPENVWMGVTVESQKYLGRIDDLRATPAAVKFLSIEPLLGPIPDLDLTDIDWVIVGGEAGPGARPINPEWVRDIRDQCAKAGIPFFFQMWGGTYNVKKKNGRELDSRTYDDMPRSDNPAIKNLVARKSLIVSKKC